MLGQAHESTRVRDKVVRIENDEETIGGAIVVTVASDLGNPRVAAQRWADAGLRIRGERRVVFDMRDVEAMDRMGIASMVRCIDRCRSHGGRVALSHVSPETLALLELNGVPALAPVCEDTETAVRMLSKEGQL